MTLRQQHSRFLKLGKDACELFEKFPRKSVSVKKLQISSEWLRRGTSRNYVAIKGVFNDYVISENSIR